MNDSIFTATMADMTRPELIRFIKKNPDAAVLLPLGVIEAHGPHLCLGTDIYSAHEYCRLVSEKLTVRSKASIIAPPFYWGMNKATEAFTGSFNSREEIVAECIYDILHSLRRFGFKNVFGLNSHGDPAQHRACINGFRMAQERDGMTGASYILSPGISNLKPYGLTGEEPYILSIAPKTIVTSTSEYEKNELHAGGRETAVMLAHHPCFVDLEIAKTLEPVTLTPDQTGEWVNGEHTVEYTPDIYVGAPADYVKHDGVLQMQDLAVRIADAVDNRINTL